MIYPPAKTTSKLEDRLSDLVEVIEKEHKRLLARKSIIEKRKEEQERQLLEMEREEEAKRQKLQKITEEAEQRRLATEFEQMKNQRILREVEERELEEAQALLLEAEKRGKKKGKRPVLEGEKITKQTLMELAHSEQLREKQEMENRSLQRQWITWRGQKEKRQLHLLKAAFQQRLVEEEALHKHEQQQEIAISRQRHTGDLEEKRRLGRMLENKHILQEKMLSHRSAEYKRLKEEKQERINQIIRSRKQGRENKRKMIYFLRSEEEKQKRLREEEDARKLEEMERRKKEDAERKAKLDEIAEKQRQRELELEEKENKRREELLRKASSIFSKTETSALTHPADSTPAVPVSVDAAPATGKCVPRFRKMAAEGGGGHPPSTADKWSSGSRMDDRAPQPGDRWRDDRKPSFGAGGTSSRQSWSSTRARGDL